MCTSHITAWLAGVFHSPTWLDTKAGSGGLSSRSIKHLGICNPQILDASVSVKCYFEDHDAAVMGLMLAHLEEAQHDSMQAAPLWDSVVYATSPLMITTGEISLVGAHVPW